MLNPLKVHSPTQSPSPGKADACYRFQGDVERGDLLLTNQPGVSLRKPSAGLLY